MCNKLNVFDSLFFKLNLLVNVVNRWFNILLHSFLLCSNASVDLPCTIVCYMHVLVLQLYVFPSLFFCLFVLTLQLIAVDVGLAHINKELNWLELLQYTDARILEHIQQKTACLVFTISYSPCPIELCRSLTYLKFHILRERNCHIVINITLSSLIFMWNRHTYYEVRKM
jgi:hypothetical protein